MNLHNDEKWRDSAICAQLPPEITDPMFFGQATLEAQDLCSACPVIVECGEFADANRIPTGVYAGETAFRRRRRLGISDSPQGFSEWLPPPVVLLDVLV